MCLSCSEKRRHATSFVARRRHIELSDGSSRSTSSCRNDEKQCRRPGWWWRCRCTCSSSSMPMMKTRAHAHTLARPRIFSTTRFFGVDCHVGCVVFFNLNAFLFCGFSPVFINSASFPVVMVLMLATCYVFCSIFAHVCVLNAACIAFPVARVLSSAPMTPDPMKDKAWRCVFYVLAVCACQRTLSSSFSFVLCPCFCLPPFGEGCVYECRSVLSRKIPMNVPR